MEKVRYKEMKVNAKFITDNIQLIRSLLKYENDTMTYNNSNYIRVKFAIDNSIELLNEIKRGLEISKPQ
jgi:hypothetical protein